jgi:hypothetical protein
VQKYDASMTRLDQDYARVLSGIDPLTGEMAKNLLLEAGVPSLVTGPDYNTAEAGALRYNHARTLAVFVPRAAEALARDVLDEAFGGEELPMANSGE